MEDITNMKIIEGQKYKLLCSIEVSERENYGIDGMEINTLEQGTIVNVEDCSFLINPDKMGDISAYVSFIIVEPDDSDFENTFMPVDLFMACFEPVEVEGVNT